MLILWNGEKMLFWNQGPSSWEVMLVICRQCTMGFAEIMLALQMRRLKNHLLLQISKQSCMAVPVRPGHTLQITWDPGSRNKWNIQTEAATHSHCHWENNCNKQHWIEMGKIRLANQVAKDQLGLISKPTKNQTVFSRIGWFWAWILNLPVILEKHRNLVLSPSIII
jgi:hypothetical protein